jgi:hypothetical protein
MPAGRVGLVINVDDVRGAHGRCLADVPGIGSCCSCSRKSPPVDNSGG